MIRSGNLDTALRGALAYLQGLLAVQRRQQLGVSAGTLRNGDRAGKVGSFQNLIDGYRLFRRSHLIALFESNDEGKWQ